MHYASVFVKIPIEVLAAWCPLVFTSLSRLVLFISLNIWRLTRTFFFVYVPMFEVVSKTMWWLFVAIPFSGDLIFTSLKL